MKCAVVLALAVACVCIAEISGDCTPGMVFKQDCNTCHCGPNGKVAACTAMACLHDGTINVQNKEGKCTPGLTWKHDCNTCICTSNGVGICTSMACL